MPNEVEIWRDAVGYEGLYQVSNLGRIKSLPRKTRGIGRNQFSDSEKILKPVERRGYLDVNLCGADGLHKIRKVHRLVAMAFLPNPDNLPHINHKDENKCNNAVSNLEWCTAKYNCNYGTRNRRISAKKQKTSGGFAWRFA